MTAAMAVLGAISGYAVPILVVGGILLLLIRLMTPKIDVREPPLAYPKIPYFGHLIGILKDNIDYFPKFINNRTPSAITLPILNGKVYVITKPDLVQAALRNKNLDFTPFINDFTEKMLNVSQEGMGIINYEPLDKKLPTYMRDVHNAMHESLQPGEGLLKMNARVLDKLADDVNIISPVWEHKNLYMWLRDIFTVAAARALYGPNNIVEADPAINHHLWNFDEDQTLLMSAPFPKLVARKAYEGREACQAAFLRYYENGHDKDATALVQARNVCARKWQVSLADIAKFELSVLFVTTTNAMPSVFWMLVYILSDPKLFVDIREELLEICQFSTIRSEGGIIQEGVIDISKFNSSCPLLSSTYHETLRFQNAQVSVRKVMEDTILSSPSGESFLLKAGNVCQMPSGITHASTNIWGPDADSFDARRFIKRDSKDEGGLGKQEKKAQTQGFFPFGGGKHLCPGRFFALAEILGLAAMLILGFDIEAEGGRMEIPKARKQKFGVGVKKPATEPGVRIRRRSDLANVRWRFLVGADADIKPGEDYQ